MAQRHWGLAGTAALAIAIFASVAPAATTTTTPFLGITLHQRVETSPRPLRINVAVIDLTAPGIDFRVTPHNGGLPYETTRQTTPAFLAAQGAQLAVNGAFYSTDTGVYADNSGLVVSDGNAYSPFSDYHALNISDANVATIVRQATNDATGYAPTPAASLWNAVSGNRRLVRNGANNITSPTTFDTTLNPRTAAGVAPGNKLVLLTVDGRRPGVSEGMTTPELADLLLSYGVTNGINLDGGGSTTMALRDTNVRVLNLPSDGSPRAVGTNLAVFARPVPEPAAAGVVLCFILAGLRRTR